MGFRLPRISSTKRSLSRSSSNGSQTSSKTTDIPKGYFAVYVGESQMKRFVIPVSYLNQPSFMDLLSQAEGEYGYNHPMGAITIPCSENAFLELTSALSVRLPNTDASMVQIHTQNSIWISDLLLSFRNMLPSEDEEEKRSGLTTSAERSIYDRSRAERYKIFGAGE